MTFAAHIVRSARRGPRLLPACIALLGPLLVYHLLASSDLGRIKLAIEILAATLIILALASRPAVPLFLFLLFVPFQQILLSGLFRIGGPTAIVRPLGSVKEVSVLALAVAAVQACSRKRRRFDVLDRLALAYVLLLTAYLLLPLIEHSVIDAAPFSVRLLAWRTDAEFAVLFIAVRRVDFSPNVKSRVGGLLLVMSVVAAAAAFVEFFASSAWNSFLVSVLQVPQYQKLVLHSFVYDPTDLLTHGTVAGKSIIRVGSILLSPLSVGFYVLTAFAIGLERLGSKKGGPLVALGSAGAAATVVLTVTRAALLGLVTAAIIIFLVAVSRRWPGRVRLGVVLVGTAMVVAPLAGSSLIGQRALGGIGQNDTSDHIKATQAGFDALVAQPLGRGLGTAPGIGQRFGVQGVLTAEDSYLQIGDEDGVATMAAFVLLFILLLARLGRAPPAAAGQIQPAAMFAAGVGLLVGGLFLHIWLDFSTALTFWGCAGLALPAKLRPSALTKRLIENARCVAAPGSTAVTGATRQPANGDAAHVHAARLSLDPPIGWGPSGS